MDLPPTALAELQRRVFAALMPAASADAVAEAVALLRPSATIPAWRRLQVYRNNLQASLGAALAAVYPVVARLVGEDCFQGLAREYLRAHPSRAGHLQAFGAAMPDFLAGYPPVAALPYLPDVAALEWAYHVVYHEAELPPLDGASLAAAIAAVPPEAQASLRLRLQPALYFVASPWPVLRIWQSNQPGAEANTVSLDEGGVCLAVAQQAGEIEFRHLGPGEDTWLRALAAGTGLGAAIEAALGSEPAFDLGAAFARHLALGAFTAVEPA